MKSAHNWDKFLVLRDFFPAATTFSGGSRQQVSGEVTDSGALKSLFSTATPRAIRDDIRFNMRRGLSAQACVAQLREDYLCVLADAKIRAEFVLAAAFAVLEQGALYPELQSEAQAELRSQLAKGAGFAEGGLGDAAAIARMQELLRAKPSEMRESQQGWSYRAFSARDADPA